MKTKLRIPQRANAIVVLYAIGMVALPSTSPAALGYQTSQTGDRTGVRVEVTQAAARTVKRELKSPASLRADEQVDLFAKVSGYVEIVNVDIGARVSKGDVLIQLAVPEMADEIRQAQAMQKATESRVSALTAKAMQASRAIDTARAQVKQHEAEHTLDQLNLDRKKTLRQGEAIPQQALDEAQGAYAIGAAKLAIARAQVEAAESNRQAVLAEVDVAKADVMVADAKLARLKTLADYASVRAPFDGVVTMRGVDHGAFVQSATSGAASALLRVAKVDSLRLIIDVPQNDVPYVRPGTTAHVRVHALGDEPVVAKVTRIAGALNPMTRTMRVEVDLDNSKGQLAPGMFAEVVLELSSTDHAVVIPSKALRFEDGHNVVYVDRNGIAELQLVRVGYDDGIWAQILSGLSAGDRVITSAGGTIFSGAPIRPTLVEDS